MTTTLSVLIFVQPILRVIGVLSVTMILFIGVVFAIEERRGYLREKNRIKTEKKVFRTNIKKILEFEVLRKLHIREKIRKNRAARAERVRVSREERAKEKLRRQKELEARESFFEDGYVRGFDTTGALIAKGARVPNAKAWEYYKQMDKLADTEIFENTKEL